MRYLALALLLGHLASSGFANDWGLMATISSTMGVSGSRLCVGEASRGDIGCPSYAPSLTTAGDVSISGNVSANKFIGDGSGLTNISSVQGDRITSGTLAAIANQATNYISLTTSAVDWGYFSSGLSYLPFLHAATVSSTNISTTMTDYGGSARVTSVAGAGGDYVVSGTSSVSASSAGTIGFGTDNTLRMLVDNSGNVGIGTASPNAKLDVYGTISASTLYVNGQQVTASGSPDWYGLGHVPAVLQNISNSTGSVTVTSVYTTTLSGTNVYGHNVSGTAGTFGNLTVNGVAITADGGATDHIISGSTNIYANTNGNSISFTTNGSQRMTINSSGYVGIGTTAPQAKLQVNDTGGGETSFAVNSTAAADREMAFTTNNTFRWIIGTNSTAESGSNVGSDLFINAYTDAGSYSSTGLFIKRSTGNVGIGTTSPSSTLTVSGSITTGPGNSAGIGLTLLGNGSGSEGGEIVLNDAGNANNWSFDNYGGTLRFYRASTEYFKFNTTNAYKAGGGSWAATSDIRLKNIDGDYTTGLKQIAALRPVVFHYRKDNPRHEPSNRQFVGVIAQEVRKVIPEAITTDADGYLSYDGTPVTFALINAVKELKAENDALRSRVEKLERKEAAQ